GTCGALIQPPCGGSSAYSETWIDVDCEGGELAFFDAESGDEADHGGVVGAKMGFSGEELEGAGGAFGGEAFAQTGVAAHAAAESDNGEAGVLDGAHGFANE